MTSPDPRWLIAESTDCTCLDDRYELAWAISDDGEQWPIIRDRDMTGPQWVPLGADCPIGWPAHERTGSLWGFLRCGRPTHAGTPCQTRVRRLDEPCAAHRGRP
jgi:hypothetical protein